MIVLDILVVYIYTDNMIRSKVFDLLRELGLNQLEAEIYIFLLPQPPMTAYKIAKNIGKPTANVYKAVERLSRKGALIIEEGPGRTCRAVPARVFLRRAEQDYREISLMAQKVLKNVEVSPIDEHVYRVDSVEQVYAYCREMLDKAKVVVVIDAFPIPLQKIASLAADAVKRGVKVFIEAYEPITVEGAQIAFIPIADKLVSQWNAQQLNVVVDGEENLMALLTQDGSGVLQAYWSNSLYLSCLHHGGRLCEQTLVRALQARQSGVSPEEIMAIIENHSFFMTTSVPGQQQLSRRYAVKKERI